MERKAIYIFFIYVYIITSNVSDIMRLEDLGAGFSNIWSRRLERCLKMEYVEPR